MDADCRMSNVTPDGRKAGKISRLLENGEVSRRSGQSKRRRPDEATPLARQFELRISPDQFSDASTFADAMRRQRVGVRPVACLKRLVKWLWCAKPHSLAISTRSFSRNNRSAFA